LPVLFGIVTFEKEEDKRNCVSEYLKKRRCCCIRCCTCLCSAPEQFKYENKNLIIKETSEEPSNIIWQNLEVGACSKFIRYLFIGLLCIILFVISGSIMVYSKKAQEKMIIPSVCSS